VARRRGRRRASGDKENLEKMGTDKDMLAACNHGAPSRDFDS